MKKKTKIKKQVTLPPTTHKLGYADFELKQFMSKEEYKKFGPWISGQTCARDEHGILRFYSWDVLRFLKFVRLGIPTYFD